MLVVVLSILLLAGAQADCGKGSKCAKELEDFRIEEIKNSILAQLGMSEAPAITMPSLKLSEQYARMANDLTRQNEAEKTSEVHFVIGHPRTPLTVGFDLIDKIEGKKLVNASLTFQTHLPDDKVAREIDVEVYSSDGSRHIKIASERVAVTGRKRLSVHLPVELVNDWSNGLFVSAVDKTTMENLALHPKQAPEDFNQMILQIQTESRGRVRRSTTPTCDADLPSPGCCLYNMKINFKEIGWDWVIQPHEYDAFLCTGSCQLNSHHFAVSEPGHSKVLKAIHRATVNNQQQVGMYNATDKFCCHATEFEPLEIVFLNRDATVTVKTLHGMIARKCGCA